MTKPWDPDRSLTPEGAARAIAARFPDVDSSGLSFLGSGWEFDAWLTRDDWVFRFPRRAEGEALFDLERRVHELVRPFMPPALLIPRVELNGSRVAEFPYCFAGHRFIPGISADEVDPRHLPGLARQLAGFLGALHGIPEASARAAGVSESDGNEEGRQAWVEARLSTLDALGGRDPVVDDAVAWVRQIEQPGPPYRGPLCVIHQDLSPEHVLVDPETGRLTGILDWTDAILGDPARDFVFIVAWRGWAYVEDVIRHYPHGVDEGFRDRLRFMSKWLTVLWLALAHERNTEFVKLTGWVRNAFAVD